MSKKKKKTKRRLSPSVPPETTPAPLSPVLPESSTCVTEPASAQSQQSPEKSEIPSPPALQKTKSAEFPWITVLIALVLLMILLYPRIAPFVEYFQSDAIVLRDPDSCYHSRRITYTATHNMKLPFYDPLLAHPDGAVPVWSPLHDWLSALPSFLLGMGKPSEHLILTCAAVVTILLAILQMLFIALLTAHISGNFRAGLLAAFLTGISIPQTSYTSLEILDHTSLQICLFALSLYALYLLLQKNHVNSRLKNVLPLSITIALLFWAWPGSFVYAGIITTITIFYIIITKNDHIAHALAKVFLLACILVLPLAVIHSQFNHGLINFEFISFFTILFLLSIATLHCTLSFVLQWLINKQNKLLMFKSAFCIAMLLILAYLQISPLKEGLKYAVAQNAWLSTISESQPLFFKIMGDTKIFTLHNLISNMSYIIFLFPLAFIFILIKKVPLSFQQYCIIIVPSIILGALAINQQKFIVEFSIQYGISVALFLKWLMERLRLNKLRYLLYPVVIIIAAIPMYSSLKNVKAMHSTSLAYQHAYQWLKQELNLQNTGINSKKTPQEGVLSTWDIGHHLQYYSHAPTVADNFGYIFLDKIPWEGFNDMARFYLAQTEEEAIAILKKYKCNYVITQDYPAYSQLPALLGLNPSDFFIYQFTEFKQGTYVTMLPKSKLINSVGYRLSVSYGSSNAFTRIDKPVLKALRHFRLLYEIPGPQITGQPIPAAYLKIFKYVEGEKLSVPANSNSPYHLEALITTNLNMQFYYQQDGIINDGIIFPYSTKRIKDYPYASYIKIYTEGKEWGLRTKD